MPCQHMPACPSCAASLTGCPQCGAEVEEKIVKPGFALVIALTLELAFKHILHSVESLDPGVGDGMGETGIPGLRLLKVDPVIENCWQIINR